MEQTAISDVELRRKRYEQLSKLLKRWITEASPYDVVVAEELEKADDLSMRCEDRHETPA